VAAQRTISDQILITERSAEHVTALFNATLIVTWDPVVVIADPQTGRPEGGRRPPVALRLVMCIIS